MRRLAVSFWSHVLEFPRLIATSQCNIMSQKRQTRIFAEFMNRFSLCSLNRCEEFVADGMLVGAMERKDVAIAECLYGLEL